MLSVTTMPTKRRILTAIVTAFGIVLVLLVAPELVIGTYSTAAAHKVRALLSPATQFESLPQQVTITIDGVTTTCTKGSAAYRHLLTLLRLRYSDDAVRRAGPYPNLGSVSRCGELTIRHLGLPFHCRLSRSTVNSNFVQIAIPYGNGRPGYALPWIIDNNQLGNVAQDHLLGTPNAKGTTTGEQRRP